VKEFFSFTVVGSIGFLIDASLLNLTKDFFGLYLGRCISFPFAVCTTYILNKNITFTRKFNKPLNYRFMKYFLLMLIGGAVNLLTYFFLIFRYPFFESFSELSIGVGSLSGMAFNFFASKFFVFKGASNK
jgi:putative flippase GtrA